MTNKKRIEYVPPNEEAIKDFARDVCKAVNDEKPDTVYGLAGFLNVVLRVVAKKLNTDSSDENTGAKNG
jgi:hypothetical protein